MNFSPGHSEQGQAGNRPTLAAMTNSPLPPVLAVTAPESSLTANTKVRRGDE
jgi:hypothetical protein